MFKNTMLKAFIVFSTILLNSTILFSATFSTSLTIDNKEKLPVIKQSSIEIMTNVLNISDVEELSDIIVKAVVLPEHENVAYIDDIYGFTKTKLKVTKVYSGDVKVDDIITLREEYFERTNKNTGETYLKALNLYEPSTVGDEYIFFLIDTGEYQIVNITLGRYPIFKDTSSNKEVSMTSQINMLSNKELNLGEGDISTYKSIYNEVIKKYD
jgi:hypothetical protein